MSAIIIGALFSVISFCVTNLIGTLVIDSYYASDENRVLRANEHYDSLQNFIDEKDLASTDTADLSSWIWEKRYLYLRIYDGNKLLFSAGISDDGAEYPMFDKIGTQPNADEILEMAELQGKRELRMKDGVYSLVIAEFTEYFYYDLTRLLGVFLGVVVLIIFIAKYLNGIIKRIKRLEGDVALVSAGDLNHFISYDADDDEISTLSKNVELMRNSMLDNIRKERLARDSNNALITSISHDIRTPLTVLFGYIDMMKNHDSLDDTMRGYVSASENTALRLKQLSDDMFKYSLAFGDENISLDIEEYDMKTLLEQMFSEHILLLKEKGYNISFDNAASRIEAYTIRTDAQKLMRIIDNLFSNLTKYADVSHPVLISVKIVGSTLTIEMKNKIRTDEPEVESNKIGLKTCRRLAELIAKDFSVESDDEYYTARLTLEITKSRQNKNA